MLADDPSAYWRLGEATGAAMVDTAGSNHGTYVGGVGLGRPGALVASADTAAQFDGVDDHATTPDTPALDAAGAVSMEVWVKRTRANTFQTILGKPGNGQSKFENYSLWFDSANFVAAYFGNGTTYVRVDSRGAIDTNWHHIVATYNNATARMYIDGTLVSSVASTVALTPNGFPLYIGRARTSAYYFQGLLDEVAVYPTALTAAQIRAHLDASVVDTVAPVVSVSSPVAGSSTSDATPVISGLAGTGTGDSNVVFVKVYAGSDLGAPPVQSFSATRAADGSWSAEAVAPLAEGPYTVRAEQADAAGNLGTSAPVSFSVDLTAPVVTLVSPADGSTSADATPEFAGVAGTAAGDAAVVVVRVYAGSTVAGAPVQTLSLPVGGGGAYSGESPTALAVGTYTAQAEQADAVGHTGLSASTTFAVPDQIAPSVSVSSPVAGSSTSDSTPLFAGSAGTAEGDSSAVLVNVYAGSDLTAPPVQSVSAAHAADGSWSTEAAAPLAAGPYTVRAEQADAAGNVGLSAPVAFTVDLTAPVVSLTSPANGSSLLDVTPEFRGAGGTAAGDAAVVLVHVYAGPTVAGSPVQTLSLAVGAGGAYAGESGSALATGTYTARAEQSDAAGHTGVSAPATFTIDPPVVAAYEAEVLADAPAAYWRLGEASGTTAADVIGSSNATYVNGVQLGQPGAIAADGNTSIVLDGVNDHLTVGDRAALDLTSGASVEVWLKRTKSSAYQVVVGKPGNGQSKFENYGLWLNTGNQAVVYFGNGTSFVSVASAALDTNWHHVVATYDNATARMYVDGQLRASSSSSVQLTQNALPLNMGRANDNAYFFGGRLDEIALYPAALPAARVRAHYDTANGLDTVAPVVALSSPTAGSFTGDVTPTVAGTAGLAPGDSSTVTVRVYAGTSAAGPPTATMTATRQADGSFAVDVSPALAHGTYTAQAEQQDAAGNVGRSTAVTFAVDTVAPAPTLTAPAGGAFVNTTPTFAGVAGTTAGDSTSLAVRVFAGSTPSGTPVQVLPATSGGGGAFSVTATTPLDVGTYTAVAEQADAAGNVGLSAPTTFEVTTADVTAPAVTVTQPVHGSSTSDTTPTFAGAAGNVPGDLETITVRVYLGLSTSGTPVETLTTTRTGATWTVDAFPVLSEATYTVQAEQSDASGNVGRSAGVSFTIGTSYRDQVVSDGAVAYWRLGESSGTTAADERGVHNGTYNGGVTLGVAGALTADDNTAIRLDGVNDYVTVPDHAQLDMSSGVTLELWAKRTATGLYQMLVGKPGNGQSRLENYAVWLNAENVPVAYFGNGSSFASVFARAPLDSEWHYIVATYDNATAKIYIDGLLSASEPSNVNMSGNSMSFNMGRELGGEYHFGGSLDEVAVYPAPLSSSQIEAHYVKARTFDSTPPVVTLTTPEEGSATVDPTPVFAGSAALTANDSPSITVEVWSGSGTAGTPLHTLTASRLGSGAWSVAAPELPLGTYTARAQQTDVASNVGRSAPQTFSVGTRQPVGAGVELLGAGDIASCDSPGDEATAAVIASFPTAIVFTLGDNVYPNGRRSEFTDCYGPSWGAFKTRTKPALGDHDYWDGRDATADGYFWYFAPELAALPASAADPNRGWYSYEAGAWHVVVLNAVCGGAASGCSAAAQLAWLQSDLAAGTSSCTLAVMSAPRWSSGAIHGNNATLQSLWAALATGGVELVLSGDDHIYERFAPMSDSGVYSPNGLRQFIVGTGGGSLYGIGVVKQNSEVRNNDAFGVLRLVLRANAYEWEFLPEAGRSFTDSGSDACH